MEYYFFIENYSAKLIFILTIFRLILMILYKKEKLSYNKYYILYQILEFSIIILIVLYAKYYNELSLKNYQSWIEQHPTEYLYKTNRTEYINSVINNTPTNFNFSLK